MIDSPQGSAPGMTSLVSQAESLFASHLGLDAVVALADGELSLRALERASSHIAQCRDCAREVQEQELIRSQLRSAPCPSIPQSLLATLCTIPLAMPIHTETTSAGRMTRRQ